MELWIQVPPPDFFHPALFCTFQIFRFLALTLAAAVPVIYAADPVIDLAVDM